jgi:hypothetical protein
LLRRESHDGTLANAIAHGSDDHPGLGAQERAMLAYARKLTRTPAEMTEADLDTLRDNGLSEEQVLDVVLATCLANFMNRIGPALGVRVDRTTMKFVPRWLELGDAPDEAWLRVPFEEAHGEDPAPAPHDSVD